MDSFYILATAKPVDPTYLYVWGKLEGPGLAIIVILVLFSTCAWGVMAFKAAQLRRARKYNRYFGQEFRTQSRVLAMYERRITAEGCPFFNVYQEGCIALEERLHDKEGNRQRYVSLKSMEHIKGLIESAVAREAVALESGIILLAIAVSGAPFMGLLGTVWGVMEVFSSAAQQGNASLNTVAPGVAAALATTVAGLLVAIPSMFGYNWLVHTLRVATVEMDNFAQEFSAKIEAEYLQEVPVNVREPRNFVGQDVAPESVINENAPAPSPVAEPLKTTEETYVEPGRVSDGQPELLPPDAEESA